MQGRDAGARFRRHRSAAVGAARRGHVQDHDRERRGADLFRPGSAARLRASITARRSAPSARRRSSIPTARCASGARRCVLGPNINLPMQDDAVAPAFAAASKAHELAPGAAPREQALIAALSHRYARGPESRPRAARCGLRRGDGDGGERIPRRQRDRGAFYAEAVMDLSPWDYWQKGGGEPNPQSAPIVPTLERVLARTRTMSARSTSTSTRSKPRTGRSAPSPMPTGCAAPFPAPATSCTCRATSSIASGATSTRSPTTRRRSPLTRNTWRRPNAPMGVYRLGYYPHNVHFVLASAQMAGDGPTVIAAAEKLRGLIPDEVAKRHRDGAAGQGGAVLRACAVQHAATRSSRCPIPAAPCPTSRPSGTTRAALPSWRRAMRRRQGGGERDRGARGRRTSRC